MNGIFDWLENLGQLDARNAAGLAALFVLGAFVPFPRTLMIVATGAAFGFGALIVILPSTTLGCMLAFLLARTLLQNRVHRWIMRRPALRILALAVDEEGWRIAALLRFGGPIPNAVQNFMFGLTRIDFVPYMVITFVFTLPQIVLYTSLGASGRALLQDRTSTLNRALIVVAVLVLLGILFLVIRRVRILLTALKVSPERS